jgi:hypothetical protein
MATDYHVEEITKGRRRLTWGMFADFSLAALNRAADKEFPGVPKSQLVISYEKCEGDGCVMEKGAPRKRR